LKKYFFLGVKIMFSLDRVPTAGEKVGIFLVSASAVVALGSAITMIASMIVPHLSGISSTVMHNFDLAGRYAFQVGCYSLGATLIIGTIVARSLFHKKENEVIADPLSLMLMIGGVAFLALGASSTIAMNAQNLQMYHYAREVSFYSALTAAGVLALSVISIIRAVDVYNRYMKKQEQEEEKRAVPNLNDTSKSDDIGIDGAKISDKGDSTSSSVVSEADSEDSRTFMTGDG
jgi:hypothetical protein